MHISLDNISFYSHPTPAKPLPCAFPVSCWKPYETPLAPRAFAPRALSHAPLPRLPSRGTTMNLASDARPDASPASQASAREDPDLHTVFNEFDIEIEKMAMAQNDQVAHEAGWEMHRDSGLLSGTVTVGPESQRTSLATGPSVTPPGWLGLPRDRTPSLGTCDEADKDPTAPEVRFTCVRASPSPSPDLLGIQHSQAGLGPETITHDESVVDNTKAAPESCADREEDPRDGVTTIQSDQIYGPAVLEASPDIDNCGRLAEESQAPASPRCRPQTRPVEQSKDPLTSTRSLRPRSKAKSTWPERFPSVSVVIPTCRADKLVASTKTNPLTRARRYDHYGDGDSDSNNLNNNRLARAVMGESSPFSGGSSPKARGRPRKRLKRAMENTLASTSDTVGKCTSQSPNPLESGFAVTLGKTQEIFGRGVLRLQAHGPRHVYYMTFLPEVTHCPSMPSPTKFPPDPSSSPEDISESTFSRQVGFRESRKRTMSTTCQDGDEWSARPSTKPPRNSQSRKDRNKAQRKPRTRLP
ncbi:hypothetical protein N7486_004304 [Penicillium sp. IBT 16267x]|nr:hypothetical protein N7486_004304 [Penicillium sp. IBT 16267x]